MISSIFALIFDFVSMLAVCAFLLISFAAEGNLAIPGSSPEASRISTFALVGFVLCLVLVIASIMFLFKKKPHVALYVSFAALVISIATPLLAFMGPTLNS
jgi:hypothetical protein